MPDRDEYAKVLYRDVFQGWSYLDLPPKQAQDLVGELLKAGAGFACTSEPWDGMRRVYFTSDTSRTVVDEFVRR